MLGSSRASNGEEKDCEGNVCNRRATEINLIQYRRPLPRPVMTATSRISPASRLRAPALEHRAASAARQRRLRRARLAATTLGHHLTAAQLSPPAAAPPDRILHRPAAP